MSQEMLFEVTEAEVHNEGRKTFIIGKFLVGNSPTLNHRIYSDKLLDEMVEGVRDKIKNQEFWGNLGHLSHGGSDPYRASHLITELTKRSSDYHGRARILTGTPAGDLLSKLASIGKVGMSSASLGKTRKRQDGLLEVISPCTLKSIDSVLDPANASETHVKILTEAILAPQQQTPAADSRCHPTGASIALDLLARLNRPELVTAQNRHAVDWDDTYGKFQIDPHRPGGQTTFLQNLEQIKLELLQKLRVVTQQIALSNDSGSPQDRFAAYAKLIANTSDPLKRNIYQREARAILQGETLLQETIKLLGRQKSHGLSGMNENTEIDAIRRAAGSRLANTDNEIAAITSWHHSTRKNK